MAKKKKGEPLVIEQEAEEVAPSSVELEVEQIDAPDDNVEIIGKNQEFSLTMYLDPDVDPKYFVRFIKKVEQLIRRNPDYQDYIENLREELGLDTCAYLGKVDVNKAEIHLHHCISNLFTVCITVCNRLVSQGKQVSSFILADEVTRLHMQNKIALVPLTATMHELAHAGKIKIPKSVIFGDYHLYFEEHKDYMEPDEIKLYEEIEQQDHIKRTDVPMLTYQEEEE
jgi:hypothetical protein